MTLASLPSLPHCHHNKTSIFNGDNPKCFQTIFEKLLTSRIKFSDFMMCDLIPAVYTCDDWLVVVNFVDRFISNNYPMMANISF